MKYFECPNCHYWLAFITAPGKMECRGCGEKWILPKGETFMNKDRQDTEQCDVRELTIGEALDRKIEAAIQELENLKSLRDGLSGEYLRRPALFFPKLTT